MLNFKIGTLFNNMNKDSQRAWLELALIPNVSLDAKLAWIKEFGAASNILEQPLSALKKIAPISKPLKDLINSEQVVDVLNWCEQTGGECIFFNDEKYPQRLLERLNNPPLGLFIKGNLDILANPIVAFAGSPEPSKLANKLAQSIAYEIVADKLIIAANISPGIAAAILQGGLTSNQKGRCVAILGNSNVWDGVRINEEIIANDGLLISEFAPRTPISKYNYARRHRLLLALSNLLVMVEASLNCDTLKLANDAGDLGCEVAAIPASPSFNYGKGCNQLIKEGAYLVENSKDIALIMQGIN